MAVEIVGAQTPLLAGAVRVGLARRHRLLHPLKALGRIFMLFFTTKAVVRRMGVRLPKC